MYKKAALTLFLILQLAFASCQKKRPAVIVVAPVSAPPPAAQPAPEPEAPPPPAPTDVAAESPPSEPGYLDQAEAHFASGAYAEAVRLYQMYLQHDPAGSEREPALFHLAIAHLIPKSPVYNPARAKGLLKELFTQRPESPYAAQARLILDLQAAVETLRSDVRRREEEVNRLSRELERLKEIDLTRRPTRP